MSAQEGRALPAGYRMIDSLLLENFRCFERLELKGLPRINVIVGQNATGKTALLEALFFACTGNPEVLMRLRAFRGYWEGQLAVSADRRSYEAIWRECFYNFDYNRTIVAKITGSMGCSRETNVSYGAEGLVPLMTVGTASTIDLTERFDRQVDTYSQVPLVFSGVDANGKRFKYRADLTQRGIYFDATLQFVPAVYFPSAMRPNLKETADRFTAIDIAGELSKLEATIRKPFPFIKGLSLGMAGGTSVIYAQIDHLKEKIPIGVVSNGIERFLNILLGIASSTNGLVLVDELESCVHHSKISDIWYALRDFADAYSAQVFISTHSGEWLTELTPVIAQHQGDFGLLRAEVDQEGRHIVRQFSGNIFDNALKEEMEIR